MAVKGVASLVAITRGAVTTNMDMEFAVLDMASGERDTQVFAFGLDPSASAQSVENAAIEACKTHLETNRGVTFSGNDTVRIFPALA